MWTIGPQQHMSMLFTRRAACARAINTSNDSDVTLLSKQPSRFCKSTKRSCLVHLPGINKQSSLDFSFLLKKKKIDVQQLIRSYRVIKYKQTNEQRLKLANANSAQLTPSQRLFVFNVKKIRRIRNWIKHGICQAKLLNIITFISDSIIRILVFSR